MAEDSWKSFKDTKTKLKKAETLEEALKSKLTTTKSFAKVLQEEIKCLNKEFALFKMNAEKVEEKLKSDIGKAKAKILKTHEVNFFKATR